MSATRRDRRDHDPAPARLLLAAWLGGYFLAVALGVVCLTVFAPGFPVTVLLVLIAAMLVSESSDCISPPAETCADSADPRQRFPDRPSDNDRGNPAGLNQRLSYRQRLRAGIGSAIASVVSAASVVVLIYFRKPGASFFSDPMPLILCFNAILFGLSSVSNLRRALQNTEHAEAIGPAAGPLFSKISRTLSPHARSHYSLFWPRARG